MTQEIAEAFSGHRFAETYPHLAADIRWTNIGSEPEVGRDAVIAACEAALSEMSTMTTEFTKFRSIVGADSVVVDSLGRYTNPDGQVFVVASCDIYDFVDGKLAEITSHVAEVS
ncbi:MAG: nuclear transport factor 2 family protein [Nocardioides sp.]